MLSVECGGGALGQHALAGFLRGGGFLGFYLRWLGFMVRCHGMFEL